MYKSMHITDDSVRTTFLRQWGGEIKQIFAKHSVDKQKVELEVRFTSITSSERTLTKRHFDDLRPAGAPG